MRAGKAAGAQVAPHGAERGARLMAWDESHYADAAALSAALADALAQACSEALDRHGRAWLALAGGRTPLPAYRRLARADLDWSKITVLPTDERCVAHAHPACNVAALRAAFADATGLTIASLTTADGDAAASLAHAQAWLAPWHDTPFDAVVLGMGGDAHTASLFPGATGLAAALDPDGSADACALVPDPLPPEAPFARISLTLPRLLRSQRLWLAITGEDKRAVLRRAQTATAPGLDALRMPVAAILHAPDTVVRIHWSP